MLYDTKVEDPAYNKDVTFLLERRGSTQCLKTI